MTNPYLNLNDKELMLKYQGGDHMAFDVIYFRHKNKVFSYLEKRMHNKDDLEDIYQKVFIKFHRSRETYKEKYELLPWIYTITKSVFLDYLKKNDLELVEYIEDVHVFDQAHEDNKLDLESEKKLTKNEKEAIKQRYYNEKDFLEISQILQTSEVNTRKLISRGIKKLKNKYLGIKS